MGNTRNIAISLLFLLLGHLSFVKYASVSAARTYKKVDWNVEGEKELERALNQKPNLNVAKNVVLILGDGNSLPNTAAARIYKGQLAGETGEETEFIFEQFPYVALSKTYNVDHQIADSAGTATAFLSGVKAKFATVGVNQDVTLRDCSTQAGNEVDSIVHWSQAEGKSTGVVTNTRLTHATPAASYAHSVHRTWETDSMLPADALGKCEDIASQLVTKNQNVNVFLGGGRVHFLPNTTVDFADKTQNGTRSDGRNLVEEWKSQKSSTNLKHKFVWNPDQLSAVDPATTDYLFGLFNPSHMEYEALRCPNQKCTEPSLVEMAEKAIRILKKNPKGFFLLIEAGKIDLAHHESQAKKALIETLKMDEVVQKVLSLTSEKDTLVVVTADHASTMGMAGYPTRGNPILGLQDYVKTDDGLPSTVLLYADGPGAVKYDQPGNKRLNLSTVDIFGIEFRQPAASPVYSASHGGEDVAIYAKGPMAHLFFGVHEQNYVAHAMAYASCVGRNKNHCLKPTVPKFCDVCPVSYAAKLCTPSVLFALTSFAMLCTYQHY